MTVDCFYKVKRPVRETSYAYIAPRTGDRCLKETGAGRLKGLMCDCTTNTFYLMIILLTRDSLDIKELTYAIIIDFILYFDRF